MNPQEISTAWEHMHVCIIGDVMIDEYLYGKVERMSPEAPVLVVDIIETEQRLGGAANVALNCRSLGAKVSLASVIGQDDYGKKILSLLHKENIDTSLIIESTERQTTCKQRVISKHQQMLRLDFETKHVLGTKDEHHFIDSVMRYLQIQKPDVVIFEDYNKGVLKDNVIQKLVHHCSVLGLITTVDPKKDNFFAYKGVTIFKPNLKEINEALELAIKPDVASLTHAHQALYKKLQHQHTLITLSEFGVFTHDHKVGKIYPTHQRKIADVSGAGDTVIAVASMVYAATKDINTAAQWSNLAGGLVCESTGVVPIDKEALVQAARTELKSSDTKDS